MEHSFWHQKWQSNQIGFHSADENPLLVAHFNVLDLVGSKRVLVPLCGKSIDLHWLLFHGMQVVGIELSELAVNQLFSELGLVPDIEVLGEVTRYRAENIEIFNGDIFKLTPQHIGHIDAVYDRAALVALPQPMRIDYTRKLLELSGGAKQLVICYEYDQSQLDGPPFSVPETELREHYEHRYSITELAAVTIENRKKPECHTVERVWLLE